MWGDILTVLAFAASVYIITGFVLGAVIFIHMLMEDDDDMYS